MDPAFWIDTKMNSTTGSFSNVHTPYTTKPLVKPISMSFSTLNNNINNKKHLHVCITGSSSGIGLAAATRLVHDGHTVYHACRTLERAQHVVRLSGGGVPMICDLSDLNSVQQFAQSMQDKHLDVLCLNAGIMPYEAAMQYRLSKQGFEKTMAVNYIGHFLLAHLLHEQLAKSHGRLVVTASKDHDPDQPGGRVGNTTASLGDCSGLGYDLRTVKPGERGPALANGDLLYQASKAYKDSKLANVVFTREASKRFANVLCVCFNPGFSPRTGLADPFRKQNYFRAHINTFIAEFLGSTSSPQVCGDRLVYMATADANEFKPGVYYSAGNSQSAVVPRDGFVEVGVADEAMDDKLGVLLWEKTTKVVKPWLPWKFWSRT
jgi:protochlorophyllide reductase